MTGIAGIFACFGTGGGKDRDKVVRVFGSFRRWSIYVHLRIRSQKYGHVEKSHRVILPDSQLASLADSRDEDDVEMREDCPW